MHPLTVRSRVFSVANAHSETIVDSRYRFIRYETPRQRRIRNSVEVTCLSAQQALLASWSAVLLL